MTNSMIKIMLFKTLNIAYPGFKSILVYPADNKAIVKEADDNVRTVPTNSTQKKYWVMLMESKGLEYLDQIYIDQEQNTVVFKGDKEIVL